VFAGKAVAIIGASIGSAPGSPGSGRAQLALRQALIFLDMIAVNQLNIYYCCYLCSFYLFFNS
jgi:hypothetical protein